jgi:hypothetical protein
MNGWTDVNEQLPPALSGEDYSANVWGWDGQRIMVVSFFRDEDGWNWANAYGNIWGEAEFDDDYAITHWRPIVLPLPPTEVGA